MKARNCLCKEFSDIKSVFDVCLKDDQDSIYEESRLRMVLSY